MPQIIISDHRNLANQEYIMHLQYYSKSLKTKDKKWILKAARQ